jgi:IMP dehydrogenase
VLIVPSYSEVLPREVSLQTRLTADITLNIPIVSAAMDTVTEYRLAIALAAEGGLGFLHKNMSVTAQANQVRRVKRYESGLIVDPIALKAEDTLATAFSIMAEHKIGGIPIVDEQRRLVGILTNRDVRFLHPTDAPIREFMTRDNLVTVPEGTTLEEAEQVLMRSRGRRPRLAGGPHHVQGYSQKEELPQRLQRPPGPTAGRGGCGRNPRYPRAGSCFGGSRGGCDRH